MSQQFYMGIPRAKIPWCPRIDIYKCIGCEQCSDVCPNREVVLRKGNLGKMEVMLHNNCDVLCDKCAGYCPVKAISFPDKEVTKKIIGKLLQELQHEHNKPERQQGG